METRLKRRHLLVGLGASSLVATSGCTDRLELGSDDDDDDDDGLWCSPGYRKVTPELEDRTIIYDDQLPGISLEVPSEVETDFVIEGNTLRSTDPDQDFTVTLTNSSDQEIEIYDDRFAVQSLDDDGTWRMRVGIEEDYEWTEQTTTFSPGDDQSWELRAGLSETGLEQYTFCYPPRPGRYRLLFWGLPDDSPGEPLAIAREFEIVEQEDTDPRWNISSTDNDTESEANGSNDSG